MLLGQNGGRHQVHHLLALLHRLKGRPKRNLRLAVAHVTTDQAVHDTAALHVALGIFNGSQLVLRLIVGEQLLKLLLPHRILAVLVAAKLPARRVKLHQILRNLLNRRLDLRLRAVPLLAAQLI